MKHIKKEYDADAEIWRLLPQTTVFSRMKCLACYVLWQSNSHSSCIMPLIYIVPLTWLAHSLLQLFQKVKPLQRNHRASQEESQRRMKMWKVWISLAAHKSQPAIAFSFNLCTPLDLNSTNNEQEMDSMLDKRAGGESIVFKYNY